MLCIYSFARKWVQEGNISSMPAVRCTTGFSFILMSKYFIKDNILYGYVLQLNLDFFEFGVVGVKWKVTIIANPVSLIPWVPLFAFP